MWPEPDSCIDPSFGWGQPFQGSLGHGAEHRDGCGAGEGKKSRFIMEHLSRQLHLTFQNATASLVLKLSSGFTSKSVLQTPVGFLSTCRMKRASPWCARGVSLSRLGFFPRQNVPKLNKSAAGEQKPRAAREGGVSLSHLKATPQGQS